MSMSNHSTLLGASLVVPGFVCAPAIAQFCFEQPWRTQTGSGPTILLTADLNDDRYPDLVAPSSDDHGLWVHLNDGFGRFLSPRVYAAGSPYGAALGDLDGNGSVDMVGVSEGFSRPSTVTVWLNAGDGSFVGPTQYQIGLASRSIAIGDIDRDGDADLVASNSADRTISILLNEGGGTFLPPVTFAVGTGAYAIALADFDGDQFLDIAAAGSSGSLALLLNNQDGTFREDSIHQIGTFSVFVLTADLNDDQRPDVVTADRGSSTVSVLLNNGASFDPALQYSLPQHPEHLACGDLDGNGALDIAVALYFNSSVAILPGRGDGTFAPHVLFPGARDGAHSVGVGDFDIDGDPDIAVTEIDYTYSHSDVYVLSNSNCRPRAELQTQCPQGGAALLQWSGATPNGRTAILRSRSIGRYVIRPGYPCAGTELGLSGNGLALFLVADSNEGGARVLGGSIGSGICGSHIQLLDLSSCRGGNVVRIE